MNEHDTIQWLIDLLDQRTPFVHYRFGDGDVFFATGTGPVLTGDGETFTPVLRDRLRRAWRDTARFTGRLIVGDVETYAVSDGCEEQWRELVAEAEEIRGLPLALVHMEALRVTFGAALPLYQALAQDGRRKAYAAPARLAGAARMLDAIHVPVPLETAHEHADRIAADILDNDPEIVLFSAGRGGKIMQSIISMVAPDITQIDIGSGLDILFTDLRRGTDRGADPERWRREYRSAGLTL